jgi:entericidin B
MATAMEPVREPRRFPPETSEETTMIRNILLALVAVAALAACNTVRGAGQDIESAGDAVSDQARETQQDM